MTPIVPSSRGCAYRAAAPAAGGAAGTAGSGISGGSVIRGSSGNCAARSLKRVDAPIAQTFHAGRGRYRRDDPPAARAFAAFSPAHDDFHAGSLTVHGHEFRLRDDEQRRKLVPITAQELRRLAPRSYDDLRAQRVTNRLRLTLGFERPVDVVPYAQEPIPSLGQRGIMHRLDAMLELGKVHGLLMPARQVSPQHITSHGQNGSKQTDETIGDREQSGLCRSTLWRSRGECI